MKTLNWRAIDLNSRNLILSAGHEVVGQLSFISYWNSDAVYSDKESEFMFNSKGIFKNDILISKKGQPIGELNFRFFGDHTLTLSSGEKFILSSSPWGRDVNWKSASGEVIVHYQQTSAFSTRQGFVNVKDSLDSGLQKLLTSSGLFARQLMLYHRLMFIAIVCSVLMMWIMYHSATMH